MRVPSPIELAAAAPDLLERINCLPVSAGIYALGVRGQAPHLSWSSNLRARLRRLLLPSHSSLNISTNDGQESLLARLQRNLAAVQCWPTSSRLESALLMHALAKRHFPHDYLSKLRLRMPWFITLAREDAFPRLAVTNRSPSRPTPLFGPFLTRDLATDYEQRILGLFQIRRCTEFLAPFPEHPGCIYGEMSQCLRPCQAAVTADEYAAEVARVSEFLFSNGKNTGSMLSMARDRAAEATNFEEAAYLHKRLERVLDAAAVRDPVVGEIDQFSGIALTRGLQPREFQLWPLLQGYWQEPLTLAFPLELARPASLDRELRERLHDAVATPSRAGHRMEDLAIFSRWYYSSWRDGSWYPFRSLQDLNYRKLVREISSIVKEDSDALARSKTC